MNKFAHDCNYDLIVTGHNLDDEDATLLGNLMGWQIPMLQRQAPMLKEAPGLVRKAKPLCRFYERETAAYAILRDIKYIEDECPFAEGSTSIYYKNILNRIEIDQPGVKLRLYVGFLKAKRSGMFPDDDRNQDDRYERRCSACGQPTTAPGLCAFCRLLNEEQKNVTLHPNIY